LAERCCHTRIMWDLAAERQQTLRDFALAMRKNRKNQAVFDCVACGAGPCNAEVNAARNIAAGRAVTARGDLGPGRSVNREPQLSSPAA
jgi:putative transposase